MRFRIFALIFAALFSGFHSNAAEYFVAREGSDAATGLARESAFATIGKGISVLKPGDTLTIMPGEYREHIVSGVSGTKDAPVTIRAWRAGSVLLRGDVDLDDFAPVPDVRHVFSTTLTQRAESVFERSTLRTLEPKQSLAEVEMTLGSFFQDTKSGRLFVHTTDSLPPKCHAMGASVTNACGLALAGNGPVHDVMIEGLGFTGFSHQDYDIAHGSRTRWGLLVKDGERVVVRRCVSFLNSGGIALLGGGRGCVVEDCEAFGNWSRHVDVSNNINGWGVSGTTFRRNRVEGFMPDPGSSRNDITFYSGGAGCVMEDNVAINASVMIKGGLEDAVQRGNVCVGRKFYRSPDSTNIELPTGPTPADAAKFADVLNHDYRTKNVFFVSPGGDDANPGTKAMPWKTLGRAAKAKHTVYLMTGEYAETLAPESGADFRRHGHDRVVVERVELRGKRDVKLSGIQISESVTASDCENLQMEFCVLASLRCEKAPGLRIAHNLIRGPLRVVESPGGSLISNATGALEIDAASRAGLWTHSNVETSIEGDALPTDSPLIGRGLHASTVGPFLRLKVTRPLPIEDVTVHDTTDTTVTLDWTTPTQAAETTLEWGDTKIETPRAGQHSVSMNGLKPGATYNFRVTSRRRDEQRVFATHQPPANNAEAAYETRTVTTAATRAAPRTLHVPGDFKTIAEAADAARAGDTMLIHGGIYEETIRVRSSGDDGAPITFKAAPGETVWLDGNNRFRANAIIIPHKHHIVIDGLRFRHFRFAPELGTIIQISGGSQNIIRRCFHDGREIEGYVGTLIGASQTANLLIENCVFINGMGEAISASNSPDLTVRHCVFYNNFIRAMTAHMERADILVHLDHNLICDSIPQKVNNALLRIWHVDALRADHNVFFTRIGEDERRIVETANINGKKVGHEAPATYRGENLLIADVQKLVSQEQHTRVGNPGIRATPRLVPRTPDESEWRKIEMHLDGREFAPLDFADFIPAADNPLATAADGKPVGLEPSVFKP